MNRKIVSIIILITILLSISLVLFIGVKPSVSKETESPSKIIFKTESINNELNYPNITVENKDFGQSIIWKVKEPKEIYKDDIIYYNRLYFRYYFQHEKIINDDIIIEINGERKNQLDYLSININKDTRFVIIDIKKDEISKIEDPYLRKQAIIENLNANIRFIVKNIQTIYLEIKLIN